MDALFGQSIGIREVLGISHKEGGENKVEDYKANAVVVNVEAEDEVLKELDELLSCVSCECGW